MNNNSIKSRILSYERDRSLYAIQDTHLRQTYLIDNDNISKLDDIQAYLELQSAKDSSISIDEDNGSLRLRKLATGFKTKAVNIALSDFFTAWEDEYGTVPEINVIRYKVPNKKVNYRVYMLEQDGEYCFVHHDERGRELEFIKSKDKEEILNKFESYRATEIRSGRPNK